MSNSNAIVSLIFEEVAEEEDLFTAREKSLLARLYSTIDETQVKILEGIILSRAERLRCGPILLREMFIDEYKIDGLEELPRHLFEDAVMYLASFAGAN